jgi:formylglycine-generating enzyme required for sulfatase activity
MLKFFSFIALAVVFFIAAFSAFSVVAADDAMPNLDDIGVKREMKKDKPVDPKAWDKKKSAEPADVAKPKPAEKPPEVKPEDKDKKTGKKGASKLSMKPEEATQVISRIKMIYVKGGCFKMGDLTGAGDDDERPAHDVCVSPYYLAESVVTEKLWLAVMDVPVKENYEPDRPVVAISWQWSKKFLEKLNKASKKHYRLPTEAEWEFAAREGGKNVRWSGTDDDSSIGEYAWFADNSNNEIHSVNQKKPNALGFYDMSGNVWQWTEDKFDFDYYQTSPKKDPIGADASIWRSIRGGSVYDSMQKIRTTYRYAVEPALFRPDLGIRLAE